MKSSSAPNRLKWRNRSSAEIATISAAALGILSLLSACSRSEPVVTTAAAPTVAVAAVTRQDLAHELTLQAEFRPYQEVELHAKVAGYLQKIDVDFGDQVKTGQEIAVLEVPELKDDFDNASATVGRAEADYKNAHIDFQRITEVNRGQPNLVSQEEIDTAEAKDAMAAANLAAAKAEVSKYRTMMDYTRITAPFAGVITKRYADPGALIQAGTTSNTQAQPLVRLSQNDRLRLDIPVSVAYADGIRVGDPVDILLQGSGEKLSGTVARFSREVAMDTRTMETEVEVPNPDLKLIPGMYATVVLKAQQRPHALAVPIDAVSDPEKPNVFVVTAGGKVEVRTIRIGVETPMNFEVLAGLQEGDQVIVGNRTGIQPGETVTPKTINYAALP